MDWAVPPSLPEVEVSSQGDVRCRIAPVNNRWKRGAGGIGVGYVYKIKPAAIDDPYMIVRVQRGGKIRLRKVHSLVCEAFHGPKPSPRHVAAHINGDTFCNVRSNLYWATPQENMDDRERHGRTAKGERQHSAKLTNEQVREMRRRRKEGAKLATLAADFGVTFSTVGKIVSGKSWRHI